MIRNVLPWVRYRQETARVRAGLEGDQQATREALERTTAARLQAAQAERVNNSLMRQVQRNGWTELLQFAWGRRT